MSKNAVFKVPGLEQASILTREIAVKVTLVTSSAGGAGTDTAVIGYTDVDGVKIYTESGTGATATTATTDDSSAGLPTLDSDGAPGVIGIGIFCTDADYLISASVDPNSCQVTGSTTWSSPAVALTWEGTGVTGVSPSYNIWLSGSCTNLDLDAANGTATFVLVVKYKARRS